MFWDRVTSSRLSRRLSVLSPFRWFTSKPEGIGPWNASHTNRWTFFVFPRPMSTLGYPDLSERLFSPFGTRVERIRPSSVAV